VVVLVAVIYIPIKLHGFDDIFAAADKKFAASPAPGDGTLLSSAQYLGFSTLALGSALALFVYPHSVTALLASRSRDTIKRTLTALPAYSLLLGLLALLGYMAIAAGIKPITAGSGKPDVNTVVPLLFDKMFSDWFSGVAFAAIAIGALVPAAIMSIAASNLFTRNVYREYLRPDATPAEEARVSKLTSLVVKGGAVLVIIAIDPQFSIDLQLIGGVIVLQTLPSIVLGLYTRWFHRWALLAGWAAGLVGGALMLYDTPNPMTGKEHFGGAQYALSKFGFDSKVTIYTGAIALTLNLVVAVAGTLVLRAARAPAGADTTRPDDYHVEAGDPGVGPLPVSAGHQAPA
jgi:solute:Na+ symporter, SSS family